MTQISLLRRAAPVLVAVSFLAAAGCGSSDSTGDATTDTTAPADDVTDTAGDEAAPDDQPEESTVPEPADTTVAPATDASPDPAEEGGSSGEVLLTLSDGRTWNFTETTCTFDPDAAGPAAALIIVDGFDDAGTEFGIIEAWPLDGSTDTGTAFIGTLADESDEVLIFVKDSAMMDGNELEVTGGYYANVFYEEGDAPDGTYSVRCQP